MSMSLSLRQSTHLTMTPLLQRAIQLLQLSNLEFAQQVDEVVGDNPFLERLDTPQDGQTRVSEEGSQAEAGSLSSLSSQHASELHDGSDSGAESEGSGDAFSGPANDEAGSRAEADTAFNDEGSDSGRQDDLLWADTGDSGNAGSRPDEDASEAWSQVGRAPSLREHLREQAGVLRLSARDRLLVETVIEAIDEAGYLRTSLEDIAAFCPTDPAPAEDELRIALRHVQSMDPLGVGARDVAECLLLQLQDRAGRPTQTQTQAQSQNMTALAMTIVRLHLRELAQHDFNAIQRALGCTAAELQAAVQLLRSLVPRPGSAFDSESPQFVVADVIVRRQAGRWTAFINPEVVPKVRIHRRNIALMRGTREPDGQIAQCMKEARWLVRNVHQRFQTIQQVAQAIIDHQSRYFDYGEMAMRPLTLAEIAARTGMHESTVSRVTSRKYMATPRGLLEFKRFFGSHVSTAAGTPCSATAVRAVIQELVQAEDPQSPLSDIRLARMLEQRGIQVARRTVSKYRDALRIPPVEMRRMAGANQVGL